MCNFAWGQVAVDDVRLRWFRRDLTVAEEFCGAHGACGDVSKLEYRGGSADEFVLGKALVGCV